MLIARRFAYCLYPKNIRSDIHKPPFATASSSLTLELNSQNKMTNLGNPLKIAFRKKMKEEILITISPESRKKQSAAVSKRVIASDPFKGAKKVSIYLSTSTEVDTVPLLAEMFKQGKEVFVPTYSKNVMEMVRLADMDDYESLSLTKWNIKQPKISDGRENALATGGIDLFLTPGVAFSAGGGRLGHGMGFYDKYFKRHWETYPERQADKTTYLMGLAFNEQIVPDDELPLDQLDVPLDYVVTENVLYTSK